mmetsp:Transcript_19818/g.29128  ORF Transcript_19818/g.29128 Transcript_19818/m.29128 type:complete len:140 (+) Transcript_19818:57-476(+)
MIVNIYSLKINSIYPSRFLSHNSSILKTVKMNMEESKNIEIVGEKELQVSYQIPGKIQLSENEIKQREQQLKILADNWKNQRMNEEESSKELLGFTKSSEIINGRLAMFFLTTGILTEIWTKQTMIDQIDTILRIVGLV